MPLLLFFLLIVFPAVEIFVIVQVAHVIGFGWTMLALVAAAFLGSYVMRRAGASWWRALRGRVALPDGAVVTGQGPDGRAAAHAALLAQAQRTAEATRYLSSELHTLLEVVVLVGGQLNVMRQYDAFLKETHRKQEAAQMEAEIGRMEAGHPAECSGCTVSVAALGFMH